MGWTNFMVRGIMDALFETYARRKFSILPEKRFPKRGAPVETGRKSGGNGAVRGAVGNGPIIRFRPYRPGLPR